MDGAIPILNQEAKLGGEIFMQFSPIKQPHSNQGKQFKSKLRYKLSKLLLIRKIKTKPYHPECNGMVERFNWKLLNMLATSCENIYGVIKSDTQNMHGLQYQCPLLNQMRSIYLMFGWQVCLPATITYGTSPLNYRSPSEYVTMLWRLLMTAYDLVWQTSSTQHKWQKEYYGRKIHMQ